MEEQTYKRQVNKLNMSTRVIDAKGTDRHYEENDLAQLYSVDNIEPTDLDVPNIGEVEDQVLAELLKTPNNMITKYHLHDSLLQDVDETLTESQKAVAWLKFEYLKSSEKKAPQFMLSKITDAEPEEMDIHEFSTSELLKLLTRKAQRDSPQADLQAEIPILLTRFHQEMEQDEVKVMICVFIFKKIFLMIFFLYFHLQMFNELLKLRDDWNR